MAAMAVTDSVGQLGSSLAGMAGLVILTVLLAWGVLYPPPFAITVSLRQVAYRFQDRRIAEEFAALNNSEPTNQSA
jgi:hypothetical protein